MFSEACLQIEICKYCLSHKSNGIQKFSPYFKCWAPNTEKHIVYILDILAQRFDVSWLYYHPSITCFNKNCSKFSP